MFIVNHKPTAVKSLYRLLEYMPAMLRKTYLCDKGCWGHDGKLSRWKGVREQRRGLRIGYVLPWWGQDSKIVKVYMAKTYMRCIG